ncbi:MAG: hypothetical protein ACI8Z5_002091 [Lentimonas sp.]
MTQRELGSGDFASVLFRAHVVRDDYLFANGTIQTKESAMKTMTCKQLGGACDVAFHANSFEEFTELSKAHGMEMFQKQDGAHLEAIGQMMQLMQSPEEMEQWMAARRVEFEALPED